MNEKNLKLSKFNNYSNNLLIIKYRFLNVKK